MKIIKQIAFLIFLVLFITSCSVDKRLYSKGYHISWKKSSPQVPEKEQIPVAKTIDPKETESIETVQARSLSKEEKPVMDLPSAPHAIISFPVKEEKTDLPAEAVVLKNSFSFTQQKNNVKRVYESARPRFFLARLLILILLFLLILLVISLLI